MGRILGGVSNVLGVIICGVHLLICIICAHIKVGPICGSFALDLILARFFLFF